MGGGEGEVMSSGPRNAVRRYPCDVAGARPQSAKLNSGALHDVVRSCGRRE